MPFAIAPDGVRLYFETTGAGEPLLLVSGQAADHHGWDSCIEDYARYQVIVFDHRGTGDSDKPEQPPYSTRGFAQDAIAILDQLGIPRAHAYGISMGGRVCQWLGIDHPGRIGSLVLGATTPGNAHGVRRPPEVEAAMSIVDRTKLLELILSPQWTASHPEFLAQMAAAEAMHPLPPFAQRLHYLASEGHDAWDWLPTITAPTLVIHGSNDQVNPTANAYLLKERIPGAELSMVEEARHGYHIEFREKASRVVLDFLKRHPLQS